jgi:hypothetical protein
MPELENRPPDDFAVVIERWRRQRGLREDEPLLLCLDLFRIHQDHWDAIRRQELPSFTEFRDSLAQLDRQTQAVVRLVNTLIEELRRHPKSARFIEPSLGGLVLTALFATAVGIFMGKFFL